MAAVQFDNGVEALLAVSTSPAESAVVGVAAVRRRRLGLRRAGRVHDSSRYEVAPAASPEAEPEDHWDDGARASLAMVGVTFRR